MCTHTEAEMNELPHPAGKCKRQNPIVQTFHSSPFPSSLLRGGWASAFHLLLSSPLPTVLNAHEVDYLACVSSALVLGNRRTPISSLMQGSVGEHTSGANLGLHVCSQYAQGIHTPKPVPQRALTHAPGLNLVLLGRAKVGFN